MAQQVIHESERLEGYVPDVFCPRCQATVLADRVTYEYYDGVIGCYECKSTFTVQIGYDGPVTTSAGVLHCHATSRPAPGILGRDVARRTKTGHPRVLGSVGKQYRR